MKLKADVPEIDLDDPFKNCKLNRKPVAEQLVKFVQRSENGFVMAVNNKWGAGKTTFIKMWGQLMANAYYKTLYLNAWENDFENSPFIALLSELDSISGDKIALYKLQKTARRLIPKGWANIAKGVTKNYTGVDLHELEKEISKGTSDALRKEMNEYQNKKDALDDFKAELWEYIKKSCGGKPLIFIIDELDRCRPDYAVELLEKIKHLFAVNNIVFVLCIDKDQLGYAIQGRYGSSNINTEEYLRRFINYEFTLPDPDPKLYFDFLYGHTIGVKNDDYFGEAVYSFKDFSCVTTLSLRQLESFFFLMDNCLDSGVNAGVYYFKCLTLLVALKVGNPVFYNKIKKGEFDTGEFHKVIAEVIALNRKKGVWDNVGINNARNIEARLIYFYVVQIKLKVPPFGLLGGGKDSWSQFLPTESELPTPDEKGIRIEAFDMILEALIREDNMDNYIERIEVLNNFTRNNNLATVYNNQIRGSQ